VKAQEQSNEKLNHNCRSLYDGEEEAKGILCLVVDEGRKRVIGIMAAILAARKLCTLDRVRMVPISVSAIADAVNWAQEIMKEVHRVVGLKK
jgi:hypothetical protein